MGFRGVAVSRSGWFWVVVVGFRRQELGNIQPHTFAVYNHTPPVGRYTVRVGVLLLINSISGIRLRQLIPIAKSNREEGVSPKPLAARFATKLD